MIANAHEVRALLWKELRQIRRSRTALMSATLLPIMLLVVVPLGQLAAFRSAGSRPVAGDVGSNALNQALLNRFEDPLALYTGIVLPLLIALTGVVVPSVTTAYAVVTERERRSLDLLMALPVSVTDVLVAKVLSVLVVSLVVVLPLFAVQTVGLVTMGVVTGGHSALLLLVLLGAFTCSIGVTFIITILARDFRTANNLSGLQIVPAMLLTPALLIVLPGPAGFLALSASLALLGFAALFIAWKWITFERYLS